MTELFDDVDPAASAPPFVLGDAFVPVVVFDFEGVCEAAAAPDCLFAGAVVAVDFFVGVIVLVVFFDDAVVRAFCVEDAVPVVFPAFVFVDEEPDPAVFVAVVFEPDDFEPVVDDLAPVVEETAVFSPVDSVDLADPPAFVLRRREDCMDAAGSLRAPREALCSVSDSSSFPPEKKTSTGRSLEFASGINAPSPRPRPRFLRSATTYSSIRDFFSGFPIRECTAGMGVI